MQPIGVSIHRLRMAALEFGARPSQAAPTVESPRNLRVGPGSPLGGHGFLPQGERKAPTVSCPCRFYSGFKHLLKRRRPSECRGINRMGMQRKEVLLGMLARETQPSSKEAEAGGLQESE